MSTRPGPVLRSLLDAHFEAAALARVLALDEPAALPTARRVLHPPLADVLARPGKQLRARLVEHGFALSCAAGAPGGELPPALPQLVEMLHAGSLVIDDIEDDATIRRGAPALHRVWGTAVALNAGNWLYFWPLVLLESLPLDGPTALALHRLTAAAVLRCHHGQALDLGVQVDRLPQAEVAAVVYAATALKTGSLMELACALGAVAAHAPPSLEQALAAFGREVGVVLQMCDDLSGLVVPARHAKGHEDLAAARATWPWAWLAESLDAAAFTRLQQSLTTVQSATEREALRATMEAQLPPRIRSVPGERLESALARLRSVAGDSAAMAELERQVRALEAAFE
jgi:geranylgeranyl pyrophosphate synthase